MMGGTRNDGAELPESGVYVVVLRAEEAVRGLRVGRLGELTFQPGYYCYVGSAMKGLPRRLERHSRRSGKRKHWHIDYLLEEVPSAAFFVWATDERLECVLSRAVASVANGGVSGFGCSDCDCQTHLYFFASSPVNALDQIRLAGPDGGELVPRRVSPDSSG